MARWHVKSWQKLPKVGKFSKSAKNWQILGKLPKVDKNCQTWLRLIEVDRNCQNLAKVNIFSKLFLAALAALYLTLVSDSLSDWLTEWLTDATLEFWHKEWLLRLETLSDIWSEVVSRQKDRRTKGQKTKRLKDKRTLTKRSNWYCDVRAVRHFCDVSSSQRYKISQSCAFKT